MGSIYRKQMVEGVELPGIIHNSSYFYVNLGVYEDGVVSCWHKSDLGQFKQDLQKGWVVASIPLGQELSIHALGSFRVADAKWSYDEAAYYQRVKDLVKSMNPGMENIYTTTEREKEKWDKARVSWSATPIPSKRQGTFGYSLLDGETVSLFYRDQKDESLYLTGLTIYEDKTLRLEHTGECYYTPEEIDAMFLDGTLCTAPRGREWVHTAMGELLLCEGKYEGVTVENKRLEVSEHVKRAAGEEDAHDKCLKAYHAYLTEPSEWSRERLREAYEAVPEHERMYLGDMDSRDSDFIRILYCPEEKREV